jgi:CheY-like chemotaxis protein
MIQRRPLRVLIMGQQDKFSRVLATNVQCWGYEAVFLSPEGGEEIGEGVINDVEVDVLLYDLDILSQRLEVGEDSSSTQQRVLALDHTSGYNKQRFRPRFIIVLSSRSVSRTMLEQIGAIALLPKPFEMGRLQRYLSVLYRLVLAEAEGEISSLPYAHTEDIRVLVVDDDQMIAHAIQQCLAYEPGYQVAVAHEGLEAVELCLDWQPHCIVTDLIMPWMNGYQVMRCLSIISLHAMPAFVVMRALTHLEGPGNRSYLQGKTVTYVDKPFHLDHLLTTIRQACTEKKCQTA